MPSPSNSLRLQVINRMIVVLQAMVAGATYWYAPFEVTKRFVHWAEVKGFPTYSVFTDSGGRVDLEGAPDQYDEDFYFNVKGVVGGTDDTVTMLEHCIQDVRKAINLDSISGVAGTLGTLAVETRMEEGVTTDNGYLSVMSLGFFEMRVRVKISGDYGVI